MSVPEFLEIFGHVLFGHLKPKFIIVNFGEKKFNFGLTATLHEVLNLTGTPFCAQVCKKVYAWIFIFFSE